MDDKKVIIIGDFSKLEEHLSGLFDAVIQDGLSAIDIKTGHTYTGRDMYHELAQLTGRTREQVKDDYFNQVYGMRGLLVDRRSDLRDMQIAPDVAVSNRLFAKGYNPSLMIWDEFSYPKLQKPADHPSRKREPKGPRGKWGKL